MPEYTLLAVIGLVAVVAAELLWLRTGLFRQLRYWLAMAIVLGFQCLVDGWLTKLDAPIVEYDPAHFLGIRAPWDIPIEDFLFGIAMVTLTMLVWVAAGRREPGRPDAPQPDAIDRGESPAATSPTDRGGAAAPTSTRGTR